jgi:hypothetical protein
VANVEVERRAEERVPAALRVDLVGAEGLTRDVSASGLYFETTASYVPASAITLAVGIDTPGGAIVLRCSGTIMRVETRGELQGVAVRIFESVLRAKTPVESSNPA